MKQRKDLLKILHRFMKLVGARQARTGNQVSQRKRIGNFTGLKSLSPQKKKHFTFFKPVLDFSISLNFLFSFAILLSLTFLFSGCTLSLPIRTQAYASLRSERVFEAPLVNLTKAIRQTLLSYPKLVQPPEFDDQSQKDWAKTEQIQFETDWIYSKSTRRYVQNMIEGSPRKTYLQIRLKYRLCANPVLGGTQVRVQVQEEVQPLNSLGKSQEFEAVSEADSFYADDILRKIQINLLKGT